MNIETNSFPPSACSAVRVLLEQTAELQPRGVAGFCFMDTQIDIENVANLVADVVRSKVLRQLRRFQDAGMVLPRYGEEYGVSVVAREYMNNPADALAEQVAKAAMQWQDARKCSRCNQSYHGGDTEGFPGLCGACAIKVDSMINH